MPADRRDECALCGVTDEKQLLICSRCRSVSYCSQACQMTDWPTHKKECKGLAASKGPSVKHRIYKPRSKLPTRASMFNETSGIGFASVFWSASTRPSFITFKKRPSFITFKKGDPGSALSSNPDDMERIEFNSVSELDPLNRFLVSCGPLPDFYAAKESLDDALASVGNHVHMLRVKASGFTALEWAAKKGNLETVEAMHRCPNQRPCKDWFSYWLGLLYRSS